MKTWILAMTMMVGVAINAQPLGTGITGNKPEKEQRDPFTPAQRAELRSKKLALKLDLNDKQQKEIQQLMLVRETEKEQLMAQRKAQRETAKRPVAGDRFAMMNKRLDTEITMKKELKKILTAEQFAKYEQLRDEQHKKMERRPHNFKKHSKR